MIITTEEIAALNEARTVLERLERRATESAYRLTIGDSYPSLTLHEAGSLGRVAEACERAENSIFRVLNVAHNHAKVDMTETQLHNRAVEEEVPA